MAGRAASRFSYWVRVWLSIQNKREGPRRVRLKITRDDCWLEVGAVDLCGVVWRGAGRGGGGAWEQKTSWWKVVPFEQ